MCGIFGFFGPSIRLPAERSARNALAAIGHRGPDAQGLLLRPEEGLILGHSRLSIIDPQARSDQPFEARDAVLIFNGEIYNYRELRDELMRLGVVFRTTGDTEVVIQGYAQWGPAVFGRLRGMYAIALYDRRNLCIHLARDEFGIKPLCFLHRDNELVFASEVKAIAEIRSLSIDGGVLTDLLSWGFQMENASLYSGVRHLPPGTVLTFARKESGALEGRSRTVFSLRDAYLSKRPGPSSQSLRETVIASVADHMIADVPVAVALSGGLDSSVVGAAAAELHSDLQAFTFTLSQGDDPEVEHASLLCRHLGLRHSVARLRPGASGEWLRSVAWHLEEPVANVNALVSFALGAVLRSHEFKVVLVGEGADEVFGGYPWYRLALDMNLDAAAVFDAYRRRRAQSGSSSFLRQGARDIAQARHADQRAAFARVEGTSKLHAFLAFDQETQLQYSQLLRVDRMYMAHGVEARVPFLYRSVLQAATGLSPDRMLASSNAPGRQEKLALAEAFRDVLPSSIALRPKFGEQGTVNIWNTWLADALSQEFERCLSSAELRGARQMLEEFIDWRAVREAPLGPKERFAMALLIEAVDGVLLTRTAPHLDGGLSWEMLG